MALNIWALTIVKALGLGYPAVQIVFLRAIVGLAIILPWAMYARALFTNLDRYPLHILRVLFSALALTAGFFAIARLPFAVVSSGDHRNIKTEGFIERLMPRHGFTIGGLDNGRLQLVVFTGLSENNDLVVQIPRTISGTPLASDLL